MKFITQSGGPKGEKEGEIGKGYFVRHCQKARADDTSNIDDVLQSPVDTESAMDESLVTLQQTPNTQQFPSTFLNETVTITPLISRKGLKRRIRRVAPSSKRSRTSVTNDTSTDGK